MRIHDLLLEYKRDITAQKLGNALLSAAQNDSHFIKSMSTSAPERVVDAVLSAIEGMDPSRTKKYVLWLAKQYVQNKFRIEDSGRVGGVIMKYIQFLPQFKRLGKNSDLNSYSFHDLERLMDELSGTDLSDVDFDTSNPDIKVLYNGPLGTLCIPLTQEASCEVGRGTQWCTAATETTNRYSEYAGDGPLYVWRDRSGKKYQFWWGIYRYEFTDASDNEIDSERLRSFRLTHPVISKLFAMKEKEILNNENMDLLLAYARGVFKGRWPEAEPIIMQNPKYAVEYARDIIERKCHPDERCPEAEPFIMTDVGAAFDYAKKVIKGRWPEAEPLFMQNPKYTVEYARDIIKGRWTDAEPIIMQNPDVATAYAIRIIKGRWKEAEPYIMKDENNWSGYKQFLEVMAKKYG